MKLLLRIGKEGSTVETCRPDQTVKFLEVLSYFVERLSVACIVFFQ